MLYNGLFKGYNENVMKILAVIAMNAEAPPTGYKISEALKLGPATVYSALEKLEEDEVM